MKIEITNVHCKSCKILIEDILSDINVKITNWKVNDDKAIAEITNEETFENIKKIIEKETKHKIKRI